MFVLPKKTLSSITELRQDTLGVIARAKDNKLQYIFNRSKPEVVMLSISVYEEIMERIEDLEDSLLAKVLSQEPKGTGQSLATVAKKYGLKI